MRAYQIVPITCSLSRCLHRRSRAIDPCGTRLSRWSHRTLRISKNRMHPVLQVCTQRMGWLVNPGPQKSVEQYYQNALNELHKTGFNHQDIALEDVWSLGPDAAISMGEYHISGRSQNGSVLESNGRWTAVEVREGGAWKIRLLTAFPTGQAPTAVPSSGAPK